MQASSHWRWSHWICSAIHLAVPVCVCSCSLDPFFVLTQHGWANIVYGLFIAPANTIAPNSWTQHTHLGQGGCKCCCTVHTLLAASLARWITAWVGVKSGAQFRLQYRLVQSKDLLPVRIVPHMWLSSFPASVLALATRVYVHLSVCASVPNNGSLCEADSARCCLLQVMLFEMFHC